MTTKRSRVISVEAGYVDRCRPFKVRTSCGHIVIRPMREATAGVAFRDDVVLEAPHGRACPACRRPTLNARVRVRISETRAAQWAMGAVDKLNGAIGTVIAVKPDYACTGKPGYLVEFERPIPSWHSHGMPHTASHFEAEELEVLS